MIRFAKLNTHYGYLIAGIVSLTLLNSCQAFHKDIRMIHLSKEEQQPVTALLSNSPTRCVGTYLIDLPVEFKTDKKDTLYY